MPRRHQQRQKVSFADPAQQAALCALVCPVPQPPFVVTSGALTRSTVFLPAEQVPKASNGSCSPATKLQAAPELSSDGYGLLCL